MKTNDKEIWETPSIQELSIKSATEGTSLGDDSEFSGTPLSE
jgi:hypothetical protein